MQIKKLLLPILATVMLICGCQQNNAVSGQDQLVTASENKTTYTAQNIPEYTGSPYVELNNNIPDFQESEYTTEVFEQYSDLDALGRCQAAYANICQEIMPTQERGKIGMIKPSGWHTVKYDCVDGKYLYNRAHLIGFQLAEENANEKNLITGTRYFNVEGMLPFENQVADYVHETNHHVLYRVTPVYEGDNLVASGVIMEAASVEDEEIRFHVFVYNVQPGIGIDYATGDNWAEGSGTYQSTAAPAAVETPAPQPETDTTVQTSPESSAPQESRQTTYVLNTNTMKFHYPTCSSVDDMKEKGYRTKRVDGLIPFNKRSVIIM